MTMKVDGLEVAITANLFQALWTLSAPGVLSGPVWVDAVCINQVDTLGRSKQVALMRSVFGQARVVHIYLGSDRESTAEAFRAFKDLASGTSVNSVVEEQRVDAVSMFNLLAHPWWDRLWVLQEVALAKHPILHCGDSTIDFWTLIDGFTKIRQSIVLEGLFCNDTEPFDPAQDRFYRLDSVVHVYQILRTPGLPPDILMNVANGLRCSDERDRVYGLLGLMGDTITLLPDYSFDEGQIRADATFAIMQSTLSVRVLRLVDSPSSAGASWIPSYYRSNNLIGMHDVAYGPNDDTHYGAFVLERRIGDHLCLNALLVDTVDMVSSAVHGYYAYGWELSHGRNTLRKWLAAAEESFRGQEAGRGQLVYPREQSTQTRLQRDFWQTVLCGGLYSVIANDRTHDLAAMISQYQEWLEDEAMILDGYLARQLDRLLVDASFFVTEHGRMGMTRSEPSKGNLVALLVGDDIPYLVDRSESEDRRESTSSNTEAMLTSSSFVDSREELYRLKGTCFIHGLMHGEGIEEALVWRQQEDSEATYGDLWSPTWFH
ncbi:Heterokaryon incompatibility protein 6, OR allele [Fulvia fulva]|uniref:Heterokaryon incompatibility protein 6, OR allele n=1 Tax=Passalora fulva TaxID=5499 RepID=A0A9Q8UT79_PASFU|nr:Heterokaryon incompatibility protein 6, OR allele [Fulvia fulva]UJO21581.1 Heterokaryon incompatibility protein 6, OR allele [Fulvia fulva]